METSSLWAFCYTTFMKNLYFATSNKWKFNQAYEYFKNRGINLEYFEVELPESRSEDVIEIARGKARFAYGKLRKPLIVIDAGFFIKALNGFPATYVKFAEKYLGSEGILKLMEGKSNRDWEFPNVVYFKDQRREKFFIGYIRGIISTTISKGHSDFGKFNDIQIPNGFNKTFTEMSSQELRDFDNNIWKPTVFDKFIKWHSSFKLSFVEQPHNNKDA